MSARQWRWIVVIALLGFLYKSFTLRAPWFLLPAMPSVPSDHSCAVHHADRLAFCEDFTTLPGSPLLVLSCDSARREWNHITNTFPPNLPAGELWLFDPALPAKTPKRIVLPDTLADFRPLGISAATGAGGGGKIRLFVANQAKRGPRIEAIDIDLAADTDTETDTNARRTAGPGHLTGLHVTTLTDALITSPNSVAAVDRNGFFMTNDVMSARSAHWSWAVLELLSGLPGGSLVYVALDGAALTPAAKRVARLPLANGVAVDPQHRRLWVASMLSGVSQYVYSTADPTRVEQGAFLRTVMLPDNILFSPASGGLYVSGVTSLRAFAESQANASAPAPPSLSVQLLPKLPPRDADKHRVAWRGNDVSNAALRRDEWRWGTVFIDNGSFFGGVSTGGVVDGGRFVGVSLQQRGVVVCNEPPVRGGIVPEKKDHKPKDEL